MCLPEPKVCVHRVYAHTEGEEVVEKESGRVYVGMQVRNRGRSDRQEGKRIQVLLLISPLKQSLQTHTQTHRDTEGTNIHNLY